MWNFCRKRILFFLLFLFIGVRLYGYTARSINVYGLFGSDRDDFIVSLKYLKVNKSFDRYDLRQEIADLYKKGKYEQIEAELKPVSELGEGDTVDVNFYVKKKQKIKQITVAGFDAGKVKKNLGLKRKKYFSASKFREGLNAVKAYLQEEGYFDATIDSTLTKDTGGIIIALKVNPGPRYVLKDVKYELKNLSQRKVRHIFKLKIGKPYNLKNLEKGKQKLEKYLEKKNFFGFSVEYKYSTRNGGIYVTIIADRGDKYKVKDIEFKGLTLFNKKLFVKQLPLRPGTLFSKKALQKSIALIYQKYYGMGYINATVDNDFAVDKKNKVVSVTFIIHEGKQIFINDIYITGNTTTKTYVIKRELLFKKGDVFNYNKVQETKRKLYQLGYFKSVDIRQYPTAYEDKVDVEVHVEEQRTGTLSFGMSYSTQDGVLGYLEVSKNNFLGRGYRIYVKGEIGKRKIHGEIGFTNPWLFNTPTPFSFYIYDTVRKTENQYTENRTGFNTSIGRQIKTFNKVYLGFKYERIKITKESGATLPEGVSEGTQTARSVTLNFERNLKNRFYHPTDGYRVYLYNELTGGFLGGDNHFYKTYIEGSIYKQTIGEIVVASRLNLGFIFRIRKDEVPDYERYYLGGPQDIRGYNFRSIKVDNLNRGGEAQMIYNFELRREITSGLYLVAFLDVGQLWKDYTKMDFNWDKYKFSTGVGFRVDTPLGPLRFDFGWPVKPKEGFLEPMPLTQFSVGELF